MTYNLQVVPAAGSKLEPVLQLIDGTGKTRTESRNGVLGHVCGKAGTYALGIRDRDYRGDNAMTYRLHIGDIPVITAVFPLGLQRGTERLIQLEGVNLGPIQSVHVKAPADAAPGTNAQGLTLYCASGDKGGLLRHSDQYRGVEHVYTSNPPVYAEPSPDYFQYVDLGVGGLTPVGYGYRSIEYLYRCCLKIESALDRQQAIREIDSETIVATPGNSRYNEQVIEAARKSIENNGDKIVIGDR